MRIDRFWIVLHPTSDSDLSDVCFSADARGLMLQSRGGLEPERIAAVYTDEGEAKEHAGTLMEGRSRAIDGPAGAEQRMKDLLWDVIMEPRFRDRAKALLDELIARPR